MRLKMIERRKKLGLSQQYVADYLGITRSAVSAWELGRNEPSLNDLIRLKRLLKTNDDSIFLNFKDTESGDELTEKQTTNTKEAV